MRVTLPNEMDELIQENSLVNLPQALEPVGLH
jgi:hypothetical protein